ncbi:hypothetical protein D3C72_2476450 [compost metagenome]
MISAGHAWGDIRNYTLAQIEAFSSAASEGVREAARSDLLIARAAQTDAASFKKFIRELS